MEKEFMYLDLVVNMMVNLSMEKEMGMECYNGIIIKKDMKVIGKIIKDMDRVNFGMPMVISMKVNLIKKKCMVRVSTLILVVIFMKDNMLMIKWRHMVYN